MEDGGSMMNVRLHNDVVTIVCSVADLELLEVGLNCFASEYFGVHDDDVDNAHQLLTDIANLECEV